MPRNSLVCKMAGNISSKSSLRSTILTLVESIFIAAPMPFRASARACATFSARLDGINSSEGIPMVMTGTASTIAGNIGMVAA